MKETRAQGRHTSLCGQELRKRGPSGTQGSTGEGEPDPILRLTDPQLTLRNRVDHLIVLEFQLPSACLLSNEVQPHSPSDSCWLCHLPVVALDKFVPFS